MKGVRATCPACGRPVAVTSRGRLWTHGRPQCLRSRTHIGRIWPARHKGRRVRTIPGPDTWNPTPRSSMTARPAPPPLLVYETITVLRAALLCWARDTVINLRPDLHARRTEAAVRFEDEDPDVSWAAVNEFADVYAEAMAVATTPQGAA